MVEPSRCPGDEIWRAYIDGSLDSSQSDLLDKHLDTCEACQSRALAYCVESPGEDGLLECLTFARQLKGADEEFPDLYQRIAAIRAPANPLLAEAQLAPGDEFSRFKITQVLGAGGFGVVYQAYDPNLDRPIALKIPRYPGNLDPEKRARFLREGKSAGRLSHKNVVETYDSGESAGIPFLVQQLCRGKSLAAWIKECKEPIGFREIADCVAQIADGLEHAHVNRVLHRDIKPGNILLDPISEAPTLGSTGRALTEFVPKLSDFGLAKSLQGEADPTLTRTDQLLGTPDYFAPEQCSREFGEISKLSDVYALGIVLFEMITGTLPFHGVDLLTTIRSIEKDDPPDILSLRPGTPKDLVTICLKCLEKPQVQRYRSAAALADDLRRFQAGERILARPSSPAERVVRWMKRRPGWAAFGIVTFVFLITAIAALAEHNRRLKVVDTLRRRELYVSNIRIAAQAVNEGNLDEAQRRLTDCEPGGSGDCGHLGIEWRLLRQYVKPSGSADRVIQAHIGAVYSIRFHPKENWLASGGKDGRICFWNCDSGKRIKDFQAHVGDVNKLDFSPDGRYLLSIGDDRYARCWDVQTGAERFPGILHDDEVTSAEFVPTGEHFATAGRFPATRIWEAKTGKLANQEFNGNITAQTFAPNTLSVVSVHRGMMLRYFDLVKPDHHRIESSHKNLVDAISFEPKGGVFATACRDGSISVWQFPSFRQLAILRGHSNAVHSVAFSPDSKILASGSRDNSIRFWDATKGVGLGSIRLGSRVWQVAFAPNDRFLVAGLDDGTIHLFERSSLSLEQNAPIHVRSFGVIQPQSLSLLPGDNRLFGTSNQGRYVAMDLTTEKLTRPPPNEPEKQIARVLAQSSAGDRLYIGLYSGVVHEQSLADDRLVHEFETGSETVTGVALSEEDQFLVVASENSSPLRQKILFFDTRTRRLHKEIAVHGKTLTGFGKRRLSLLPCCYGNGSIDLLDLREGKVVRSFKSHASAVRAAAFSTDGRRLITAGFDHYVNVLDVATGAKLTSVRSTEQMTSALLSDDGRTMIGGGKEGSLFLWDTETGAEFFKREYFHSGPIYELILDEENNRLISGAARSSTAGEIFVWRGASDESKSVSP